VTTWRSGYSVVEGSVFSSLHITAAKMSYLSLSFVFRLLWAL